MGPCYHQHVLSVPRGYIRVETGMELLYRRALPAPGIDEAGVFALCATPFLFWFFGSLLECTGDDGYAFIICVCIQRVRNTGNAEYGIRPGVLGGKIKVVQEANAVNAAVLRGIKAKRQRGNEASRQRGNKGVCGLWFMACLPAGRFMVQKDI